MNTSILAAEKTALRTRLKQIRTSLPAEFRASATQAITENLLGLHEVVSARTVFIYISHGNEVDTHGLLRHFLAKGMMVTVPKILPNRTMIAVPFDRWVDLTPGELGILTPSGDIPCSLPIDIVITPGLGFTAEGHRIGYGRGYYDKWFAEHRTGKKIALAFDAQVIHDIPHDENDIPVEILITEKRIMIL